MEQLKKKVRIVPMTNEYLNDVAELERTCFSNPLVAQHARRGA